MKIDLNNNVPDIYPNESRDFQLYLRLLNVIIGGTKFDIDHIVDIFDPKICNNRVLDLLCTTFNFNPKIKFTDQDLRLILSGFGGLIRNKGTRKGIEQAISLVMKTQNITTPYYIDIINKDPERANSSINYYIELQIDQVVNRSYLLELLEYVKPVGYTVDIFSVDKLEHKSKIGPSDTITYLRDLDESGEEIPDTNPGGYDPYLNSNITKADLGDSIVQKEEMEYKLISLVDYDKWSDYTYKNNTGAADFPRYFISKDSKNNYTPVSGKVNRYICNKGPHYVQGCTTYRIESAEWDTSSSSSTPCKLINTYISIPASKSVRQIFSDTINTSEVLEASKTSDSVDSSN